MLKGYLNPRNGLWKLENIMFNDYPNPRNADGCPPVASGFYCGRMGKTILLNGVRTDGCPGYSENSSVQRLSNGSECGRLSGLLCWPHGPNHSARRCPECGRLSGFIMPAAWAKNIQGRGPEWRTGTGIQMLAEVIAKGVRIQNKSGFEFEFHSGFWIPAKREFCN